MSKRPVGFTVVEVMITLAVSGAIFIAGISIFNTRKADTEFDQGVYDLQSKLQSWASLTSSKAIPVQYSCSLNVAGKPVLSTGGSSTGECMYLGYAVQIIPGQTNIYAYPVFAPRSYTGTPSPEPGLDGTGNYIYVDSYFLLGNLQVASAPKAANVSGNSNEQDLLTLYSSLQDNNTSGNEVNATAYQIQFAPSDARTTGSSSGATDNLKNCIEGSGCSTSTSLISSAWKLCVTNGRRNAMISIKGTATGISTKLNMDSCS